ncbi:MAG: OadG family protein [Deltaproteobacteria bacterium]|nr:OadG family protein [Deltaproteobacteria bacterium]
MITAGIKLSVLGMGIVIIFLFLIYFIIALSGRLLSAFSSAELVAREEIKQKRMKKGVSVQKDRGL